MQVIHVDERHNGGEDDQPRFRVYLHGSGKRTTERWTDTYDITGADVLQAIDWAQRQAGHRLTYAVALLRQDPRWPQRSPELIWLIGMDGNDPVDAWSGAQALQRRMLARRHNPVGIPEQDRAPQDVHSPYVDGIEQS